MTVRPSSPNHRRIKLQLIENFVNKLELGKPISFKRLTMFPFTGLAGRSIDYLTLDEAHKDGSASVSEVSETGSVPDLRFLNNGDKPVFLLDGEELLGAKQNRILNLSILVPGNSEINIPVSCVEQGRWSYNSDYFRSSDRSYFSKGRAKKARMVSNSLSGGMSARSDQGEVWRDVAEKTASFSVNSASDAMSDVFEAERGRIDEFVENIHHIPEQAGALFAIDGEVAGFDAFDKPSTLRKLLPKLVRSYALDALEGHHQRPPIIGVDTINEFLKILSSGDINCSPSAGMGEDYRFKGDALAGGALINDGDVIHLCAFPLKPEADEHHRNFRSGMTRASYRRREH